MFPRSPLTNDTCAGDSRGRSPSGIAKLLIVAGPLMLFLLAARSGECADSARRPNVVLIFADDKY
jgi:hypothetical protein